MEQGQENAQANTPTATGGGVPRSLAVAQKGIRTGNNFADFMSCLMTDLIDGSITPSVGNAACNAGGKLLKVVEMQYKFGSTAPGSAQRVLNLTGGEGD